MKVTLKDGKIIECEKGTKVGDLIKNISISLSKDAVSCRINNELEDLDYIIESDIVLDVITKNDKEAFSILNHSCSHLLAHALKRLYKDATFGVGPSIEEGFYYDFYTKEEVLLEDLDKIEKEMNNIVSSKFDIKKQVLSKEECIKIFSNDPYKLEIINDLNLEHYTVYKQGEYVDLCKGPHITNTSLIKHFKLLNVAGAYWKGNSSNVMLKRIYGICFFTKQDLELYLNNLEERKKRDHRKIGKDLDLFMISDFGPGFPFWLPNGMILKDTLVDFWKKIHLKHNYKFIQTPIMLNKDLWELSGHWFNYRENMYTSVIDKLEFAIKPMNCPGGMLVYKNSLHSYKDFPLRLAELGQVHRHEASGALSGLFRVRTFTQDDAHIFMTKEQISEEISSIILLYKEVYDVFGLSFNIELSTRPDKYIGEISVWDESEEALKIACKKANFDFKINPKDGAFYGPKLDFKLKDSIGRIWQCGTIQLDMNLPERFDLTYIDKDGSKKRPVMAHRALFGSLERFIGILIEHYCGVFPLWLSPIQVRIIPVSSVFNKYCQELNEFLKDNNIRSDIDIRDEKLSYKIREAQIKKIPYQVIIGNDEVSNSEVSYRLYGSTDTKKLTKEEFLKLLQNQIKELK